MEPDETRESRPIGRGPGRTFPRTGGPGSIRRAGEVYFEKYKVYISGFHSGPSGLQWVRFEEGSCLPEILREIPHIAFEVEDLEEALRGGAVLVPPHRPREGLTMALILRRGAPIELMRFEEGWSRPMGRRFLVP